jgi:hypothetical protein
MPSPVDSYNTQVLEGHRDAVIALRELLAQEKDPLKRCRFANSLLRARPIKVPPPSSSAAPADEDAPRTPHSPARQTTASNPPSVPPIAGATPNQPSNPTPHRRSDHLNTADFNDADDPDNPDNDDFDDDPDLDEDLDADFDDPNDPAMQEINDLSRQLEHGPDPLAALHKLHAIMRDNFAAINQDPTKPQPS